LQRLISHDRDFGYVLDAERHLMGVVSAESLKGVIEKDPANKSIEPAFLDGVNPGNAGDSMQDILPEVVDRSWPLPIINPDGKYLGVISKNQFLRTLQRSQAEAEVVDGVASEQSTSMRSEEN
jgi:glycine betaine/proline transport system ATP-binding protein